jgi:hypothetical protein
MLNINRPRRAADPPVIYGVVKFSNSDEAARAARATDGLKLHFPHPERSGGMEATLHCEVLP